MIKEKEIRNKGYGLKYFICAYDIEVRENYGFI